jgi:hypothetical protein
MMNDWKMDYQTTNIKMVQSIKLGSIISRSMSLP